MKIAIVAPSPVPFTIGGAEKLWWGLLAQFNRMPGIQAELIKLPSPERTFSELISSYRMFRELDLSHFDAVISTKYPAWMVRHPRHIVYLQHRLRGLYDTYSFCNKPSHIPDELKADARLHPLLRLLENEPSDTNTRALFSELFALKASLGPAFESLFEFPGPLTRQVIHHLDQSALRSFERIGHGALASKPKSDYAIRQFAAIAHNVRNRKNYFPSGAEVTVIHHPSDLPAFEATGASQIFTVSRLDQAKRLDLLIRAYKKVNSELPFRIAGTGPELDSLQKIAAGDSRIEFLGRLNDEQVIQHYQESLFVPFIPYDEDYGLITIEAMQAGRAVLTTQDAGGVNEFVENNISGLSVEPTVDALASAMQSLVDNPESTLQMGRHAVKKVAHISWSNTCETLLSLVKGEGLKPRQYSLTEDRPNWSGSVFNPVAKRAKVLVVSPFRITPAQSGGQARVFYLYQALSQQFDVTLLSLGEWQTQPATVQITPYFREVVIPINPAARLHFEQIHRALQVDCGDLAIIDGILLHPEFLVTLRDLAQQSQWVIASHPYLYKAIEATHRGAVIYDAHNVESDMKAAVLKDSADKELALHLLDSTFQLEKQLIARAEALVACSQPDLDRFCQLHSSMPTAKCVVPNGVDIDSTRFQTFSAKAQLQAAFLAHPTFKFQKNDHVQGIQAKEIALFAGSWHGPNIQAMHRLVQLARKIPDLLFVVMGSVTKHPDFKSLPANVLPMGLVSDFEKKVLLDAATLMLNPMEEGSGTNLKMLEYAAAGGSIVSTDFGNRGLGFLADEEVILADIDQFADAIHRLRVMDAELRQAMSLRAKKRVYESFSWSNCAKELLQVLGQRSNPAWLEH